MQGGDQHWLSECFELSGAARNALKQLNCMTLEDLGTLNLRVVWLNVRGELFKEVVEALKAKNKSFADCTPGAIELFQNDIVGLEELSLAGRRFLEAHFLTSFALLRKLRERDLKTITGIHQLTIDQLKLGMQRRIGRSLLP